MESLYILPCLTRLNNFGSLCIEVQFILITECISPQPSYSTYVCGAESVIFQEKQGNTIAVNVLAHCITRSSATMILTMLQTQAIAFHEEWFQPPGPSQYYEKMDYAVIFLFPEIDLARQAIIQRSCHWPKINKLSRCLKNMQPLSVQFMCCSHTCCIHYWLQSMPKVMDWFLHAHFFDKNIWASPLHGQVIGVEVWHRKIVFQ